MRGIDYYPRTKDYLRCLAGPGWLRLAGPPFNFKVAADGGSGVRGNVASSPGGDQSPNASRHIT